MFRHLASIALGIGLTVAPLSAEAQCEVGLIFAIDASASVDAADFRVQLSGVAEGLRDPVVTDALVRGQAALMVVEWSGHSRQRALLDWHRMSSPQHVQAFAAQLELLERSSQRQATAIGEALAFSAAAFNRVPDCERRVIDISGDGESNEGRLPRHLRAHMQSQDITVNALVLDVRNEGLTDYFLRNVVSGRDSFAITAFGISDFAAKMRLKLYRELAIQLVLAD